MDGMSRPFKSRTEIIENLDWRLRALTTSAVLAASSIAQKVGLGANDLRCAKILVRRGPMSAGELGEIAGLTTGAITGIVDRLEKAGWAKREADPHDRRRVMIYPGPQDTATITGLYDSYMESLTKLLEDYSDSELSLLTEFLDGLIRINHEQADQK
jgi:DNA-binding MarR family transcriptional regulator